MTLAGRVGRLEQRRPGDDDISRMTDAELWAEIHRSTAALLADPSCPMPAEVRAAMMRQQAGIATADDEELALQWMVGEVEQ